MVGGRLKDLQAIDDLIQRCGIDSIRPQIHRVADDDEPHHGCAGHSAECQERQERSHADRLRC
jgi:hypothetical protein